MTKGLRTDTYHPKQLNGERSVDTYVGRTHTIVRLQTRIRRKDGTENFGGFVYVLDGFLQRDFVLLVFMCSINWRVCHVPGQICLALTNQVAVFA